MYCYIYFISVEDICTQYGIGLDGIYNADQFGLLFKQFPNRVVIDKSERATFRGVKAMKAKDRLSVMACTNAHGLKVPLLIVGKAERPLCFDLLGLGGRTPLPYTNQANAWFTKAVTKWWMQTVFMPHVKRVHGDKHVVLILDNLEAHKVLIDWALLPKNIHVLFLPPNLTSKYQPMDQGVIATVKVGYKVNMLKDLLKVCDDVGVYEQLQSTDVPRGCRGLEHGAAPHVLDAIKLLKRLWTGDLSSRYSDSDAIARCWRKADCLPAPMIASLNQDFGRSDRYAEQIEDEALAEMCDIMCQLNIKVNDMVTVPDVLKESLVTELHDTMDMADIIEGLRFHCSLDEHPLVEEVMIEDAFQYMLATTNVRDSCKKDDSEVGNALPTSSSPVTGESSSRFSSKTFSTSEVQDTLNLLRSQILASDFPEEIKKEMRVLSSKVETNIVRKRNAGLNQSSMFNFLKKPGVEISAAGHKQVNKRPVELMSPCSSITSASANTEKKACFVSGEHSDVYIKEEGHKSRRPLESVVTNADFCPSISPFDVEKPLFDVDTALRGEMRYIVTGYSFGNNISVRCRILKTKFDLIQAVLRSSQFPTDASKHAALRYLITKDEIDTLDIDREVYDRNLSLIGDFNPHLVASLRSNATTDSWYGNVESTGFCGYLAITQILCGMVPGDKLHLRLADHRRLFINVLKERVIPDVSPDFARIIDSVIKYHLEPLGTDDLSETPRLPRNSGLWLGSNFASPESGMENYFLQKTSKLFLWSLEPLNDNVDYFGHGSNQELNHTTASFGHYYSDFMEFFAPDYHHVFYRQSHYFLPTYTNDFLRLEFRSAFDDMIRKIVTMASVLVDDE